MEDNSPFTKEEKEIMDLLVQAHSKFVAIEPTHPMEMQEWVYSFHKLQDLLGSRILRRNWPQTFK